jgi:threonine/homoserine/homoserine lactone efflux protein
MIRHFESKTVMGLLTLLAVAVGLAAFGKLTPEMVEVLKYVGGAYFGVRGVANYAENMGRKNG